LTALYREDVVAVRRSPFDGGSNWTDIVNFHWTTAGGRLLFNLSSATPVTTQYTPTDGTLAANTCKDSLLGNMYRAKYTTTGAHRSRDRWIDGLSMNGLTHNDAT
jgi:hypothetical protein